MKVTLVLASFFIFSCTAPPSERPISSGSKRIIWDKGAMVSAANPHAVDAAVAILEKGGSAVDAAIAAHAVLGLVEPQSSGLGGGGFMLNYDFSSGDLTFIDGRETAPSKATVDMFMKNGNVMGFREAWVSGKAVGSPGAVALYKTAHERSGKVPWSELFLYAINLAENGYVVTEKQSRSLNEKYDDFVKVNGQNSLYSKIFKEGDVIVNKKFAETLKKVAKDGPKAFYEGDIAKMIVDEVNSSGGIMEMDDLKNYESVWRDPVRFKYKDLDIISMSLPSSGGILLGQMLKAIEKYDISSFGHNSLKTVQLITEVERRAYADRSKYMGDPDFMDLPVYELMDDDYISERMSSFSWDNATLSSDIDYGTIVSNESLETTHYSIIDKYGNSVSVTTTLNNSYGSKVFVEEGGFFLNNEMDDFSSKPGHPNFYGLIGSEANSIQPKKRMLSSMTPTIVLKDGKPSLIVGTPGGSTIITSVLQTILNVYEFNMSVSDAVSAPRFHHQWLPDVVIVEENGFTKEVDSLLRDKSYFIISLPFEDEISGMSPRSSIGAVDAIFIDKNGKVSVGPDPRGDDFGAILK